MLPPDDCLGNIIGPDWSKQKWFESEEKRDVAFENMKIRHGYYRKTDSPTQIIEKILMHPPNECSPKCGLKSCPKYSTYFF